MRLFAVIGKSFSGKTTFINKVLSDKKFCKEINLQRLPLITNRKPRESEVEENEFVSTEELSTMIRNGELVYTHYSSEFGDLVYGIREELFNTDNNYICDLPVELIEQVRVELKEKLFIIYLCPPTSTLFKRMNDRPDNEEYTGKKWKEIARRYSDDLYKFGRFSNEYMAMVYGTICLGGFVPIDDIKFTMEKFINYPPTEPYYCEIILNGNPRRYKINTDYIASMVMIIKLSDLANAVIPICNGSIELDSNNCRLIKVDSNDILY